MPVDFVIPAHNETPTIAAVVAAVRGSPSVGLIVVVADACDDDTHAEAFAAGASVAAVTAHDKGTAMAVGLSFCQTDRVGFADADLIGLQPAHIDALISAPPETMAVGIRGSSVRLTMFPPIAGERVLPTWLARAANLMHSGYTAEMELAKTAKRYGVPIIEIALPDLEHRARGGTRRLLLRSAGARGRLDNLPSSAAGAMTARGDMN